MNEQPYFYFIFLNKTTSAKEIRTKSQVKIIFFLD